MPQARKPSRHLRPASALVALVLAAGCARPFDPAAHFDAARRFQQNGEVRAAVIELKTVLQHSPGHAAARLLLGDIYLDSGDVLSAEKEFRRARDAGAKAADVAPRLGRVLLLQRRYEQVLTELADNPDAPAAERADVQAMHGYAQLGLDHGNNAATLFAEALTRQPGHVDALLGQARMALQAGSIESARAAAADALAVHPANTDALSFQGDLYRNDGQSARALASYRQVVKLRPGNLQAHLDIAGVLAAAGDRAAARKELAVASNIAPGSAAVLYTQALLDFQDKHYQAALERLQLILRAAPDHPPSNLLAAATQFSQNNLQQAEQYIQHFLHSQPDHLYGVKLAAAIALRSGKPADAATLLQPLLERYADDAELQAAAGDAQLRLKQYAKAAAYFEKAAALAPAMNSSQASSLAQLRTSQAVNQLGLGDSQRAIAALEQALRAAEQAGGAGQRAGALLVVAHMRAGDYGKALAAVTTLEQSHDSAAIQNLKGGVLLASQDAAGARRAFEAALKLQPGYLPALQNLAELDWLASQPDQARLRYEAALARDSGNTTLMLALAQLAMRRGQAQAARGWLERAHAAAPDALAPALQLCGFYLEAGEPAKALPLAQKLQAANPANSDALALLARARAAAHDVEGALESFASLAERQPDSAALQLQLASAYMAVNRPSDALAAARKAMALAPGHGPALTTVVRLLTEAQSWDQALSLVKSAQARPATAALAYRLEGDIAMARRQPAAALPLYEKAYGMEQNGPLAIALHRALLANGKNEQAAQRIERWLTDHPQDTPTRLYLASALQAANQHQAAIAQYERIIAEQPNHVVALNDLAWSCQQAHDRRAVAFAERAYALAPANPSVADTLGWVLAQQGQAARAVAILRKASDGAPQAGDIRLHYATALVHAGERREARRQLERLQADSAFPRQDEVRALLAGL